MYERAHRDLKRVEVRVTDEHETETLNERDLQSTDREELTKSMREDIRFGAEVSATSLTSERIYT